MKEREADTVGHGNLIVKRKRRCVPLSPKSKTKLKKIFRKQACVPVNADHKGNSCYSLCVEQLQSPDHAVQEHAIHGNELASGMPQLTYRVGHTILVKALRNLNPAQQAAVGELGFANLQHLHFNDLPAKFAYWILSHFDPRISELLLDERRILPVDANDVWLTLGIPKGPVSLFSKKKRLETSLLLEWKDRVGKDPTRIRTTDLRDVMLREIAGGVWYRRHFLILMTACLIENTGNGYVNPMLIEYFKDVAAVRNLNWCQYVHDCLIEHATTWTKARNSPFKGPLLFLMLLYVDRVVLYKRVVDRCFPTLKVWTTNLLKQREIQELRSGGFGHGRIDSRFAPVFNELEDPINLQHGDGLDSPIQKHKQLIATSRANGEDCDQDYTNKVISKARTVANSLLVLLVFF